MFRHILRSSVFLFLPVFFIQCKPSQAKQEEQAYKRIYIDQFKLTYFRALLIKSYNNSNAVQEIIKSDHSGFTEPILNERDYSFIDSLTTADNEIMRVDSARGSLRAEGAQGKRPLGYILNSVRSRWLDSLAIRRFRLSGARSWTHQAAGR
ncbi:hypothetical protein [Flaviaesturariibacter terrae]